jgi:hypothetical protein
MEKMVPVDWVLAEESVIQGIWIGEYIGIE